MMDSVESAYGKRWFKDALSCCPSSATHKVDRVYQPWLHITNLGVSDSLVFSVLLNRC